MSEKEPRNETNKPRPVYNSSQGEIPIESMRLLPPEESEGINPSPFWKKLPSWISHQFGLSKEPPKGSGFGYIYPPYYSTYNLVYGLLPIADLPKYRVLYRSQPDLKAGIDLVVNLATAKGFTIEYEHDESRELLEKTTDAIDLGVALQMVARDALTFGDGYLEVLWDEAESIEGEEEVTSDLINFITEDFPKLEKSVKDKNTPETGIVSVETFRPTVKAWRTAIKAKKIYQRDGKYYCKAEKLIKGKSKNVLGVKALDPVYMRVRADPFGNIYGFIQWLQWPPAVIDTDSMIEFKNCPTSEAYATVYGQSQLLPLIKNTDLLNLFDQDVANWIHNQAVIPLWVAGGAKEDKPYSTEQMQQLVRDWANRTASTTVFTKSDVKVVVLKGGGRDLKVDWWQRYLLERRMLALGIPPIFMGVTAGIGRATGEVMLSDFITRVQSLQNHISSMIIDRLYVPLIVANFGEETLKKYGKPSIIWKPIVEEDRNKRLLNVDRLAVDGIISVNEARGATGWQPFRRPEYKDYDPEYDEPQLLRIPPQMGKLGMPQEPTKPLQQMNKPGTRMDKLKQGSPETQEQNQKPPQSQDKGQGAPQDKGDVGGPSEPKKEEITASIKNRAFEISTSLFQREIEGLIDEVDTELRMGGVLVRDIKLKYEMKADKLITKWVGTSTLPRNEKKKLEARYRQDFVDIIGERIKNISG